MNPSTALLTFRPELTARADLDPSNNSLAITLRDQRREPAEVFHALSEAQRESLAVDAWRVGLRAMMNAYKQAEEARLSDIGKTLRDDLERMTEQLVRRQREAVEKVLGDYLDPEHGALSERLDAFVRDDGELMQKLSEAIGPDGSMLAGALAQQLGEESPLLKRLDPQRKDGIISQLREAVAAILSEQRGHTERLLDPGCETSPVARMLSMLRTDLMRAENDREKQLKLATAALDPTNETSLLNQLVRASRSAHEQMLKAVNPTLPDSPLASIRNGLATLLSEHIKSERERQEATDKRQRAFEADVKAAIERLETRKTHDLRSARGGGDFESAVTEFVHKTFAGAPMTVESVGTVPGAISRCRTGDAVARFTSESSYAGAALVVEAKHDSSYTEPRAIAEMEEARKNRLAQAGVFVMAASHAPSGFPRFARHDTTVIVIWDPEDPRSDAYLHAALLLGQCMAARLTRPKDERNVTALAKLEDHIQDELRRFVKMRKHVDNIERNTDELSEDLRKGAKALERLLREAKEVLETLTGEVEGFGGEEPVRAAPIELSEPAGGES